MAWLAPSLMDWAFKSFRYSGLDPCPRFLSRIEFGVSKAMIMQHPSGNFMVIGARMEMDFIVEWGAILHVVPDAFRSEAIIPLIDPWNSTMTPTTIRRGPPIGLAWGAVQIDSPGEFHAMIL